MPDKPKTRPRKYLTVLIGAGRMGSALLKGWVSGGRSEIAVVEPHPTPTLRTFAKRHDIPIHAGIEEIDAKRVAICVVAIKPQILKTEAARLRAFAAGALIVSIAAGTSTASLMRACGREARIVRAMPNLPGAIGRGISALYAARNATPKDRKTAQGLLAALGETVWVKRETLIDAVTAVSGSGPAYVFLLVEALAQAARAEGLDAALAERLARATIVGAGALLDADARPASELRRDVTSPGGTTQAALAVLMQDDELASLLARAVKAARLRAKELSA